MGEPAKFTGERIIYTYVVLDMASGNALEAATKTEKGQLYNCITAMVFSAFCLEAYLNHLGDSRIGFWSTIEQRLSPRQKLDVLTKILGYEPDFGCRPFQTFKDIFDFRNRLAHGKTATVTVEAECRMPLEARPEAQTEWETLVSLEKAKRFRDDAQAIIRELHSKAGAEHDPFWTPWRYEWRIVATK